MSDGKPRKRRTQAQILQSKIREEELSLKLQQLQRRSIRMGYDAVSIGAAKRRRTPVVERQGEAKVYDRLKQRHAENLTRDLLRNYTVATGHDLQRRLNVAGFAELSLDFDGEDSATEAIGSAIAEWFNYDWAPKSDARDETPWAEQLQCTVSAIGTDGGILVAFDDTLQNDGRLWYWELEQLCTVQESVWQAEAPDYCRDANGQAYVIDRGQVRDALGRIVAYVVTWKRNGGDAASGEYTVWHRENARLIKRPKRHNQFVPVPSYLPMVADQEDAYEFRTSEIQSAKKAAKIYATVKSERKEDELLIDEEGAFATLDDPGISTTQATATEPTPCEALEALTGGYTDYVDEDDTVEIHDNPRPNRDAMPFLDGFSKSSGAALGMAESYSLLHAKASYTAFRGELIMTWVAFEAEQLGLRDRFLDWAAIRAIEYGLRNRLIETETGEIVTAADLPRHWQRKLEWTMPTMPVVDEEKQYRAQAAGMKLGKLNFRNLHGSKWRRAFARLKQQLAVAREDQLPFSIFETVAGAELELKNENENENENGDGNDEQA